MQEFTKNLKLIYQNFCKFLLQSVYDEDLSSQFTMFMMKI